MEKKLQLHEFQAKEIFKNFGIPIPKGRVASSVKMCLEIFRSNPVKHVIKAQIHSGGRGKAGGIKIVNSETEMEKYASKMIGSNLKTFQSGEKGFSINQVLVEEALGIISELYLAVTIDFDRNCPVIICSFEGGIEIEEVAKNTPENIKKIHVDPLIGVSPYKVRNLNKEFGLSSELSEQLSDVIFRMYEIFTTLDCSLVEINPIAVCEDNKMIALDAKITLDEDSLYRHQDMKVLFDKTQTNPEELRAIENELSYIKLFGGQIGCMVNGAGLAMATMDITVKAGMLPANFLDVGGSASEDKIREAYKIICSDSDVKLILVNIFGGILRCDVVANGIIQGFKDKANEIPMVVILRGTNSSKAKSMLENFFINITFVEDLPEAASKIRKVLVM